MRKIVLVAVLLCAVAAAYAFERIDKHIGDETFTVYNADAGTYTSKLYRLNDSTFNRGWTAAKLGVIVGAFSLSDQAGADSITGEENAVDTAIVTLYGKTEFYTEQLDRDSAASLPCTLLLDYDYFFKAAPDSETGAWRQHGLINDQLYFTVYAVDSAGAGDTMDTRIQWFLHLVEE